MKFDRGSEVIFWVFRCELKTRRAFVASEQCRMIGGS